MSTKKAMMTDWAARMAGARAAIGELHAADRQLRDEHDGAVKARARAASAPPPLEDVLPAMERLVDQHARAWAEKHAHSLLHSVGGGLDTQRDGSLVTRRPRLPDWFFSDPHTPPPVGVACGLFPEMTKSRLAAILRAHDYTPGSPLADRLRVVGEHDTQIRELEDAHAELVDMAANLEPAVVLEHLPAVRERRQTEAEERKRAALLDAERRAQAARGA